MKKNNNEIRICIYGRGFWGINTFFELKKRNVEIVFFADKDKGKSGPVIDGIYCIDYETLLTKVKNFIIVVAIDKSEGVICSLKNDGFNEVYDFRYYLMQTENLIRKIEPLKDVSTIIKLKQKVAKDYYENC